MIDLTNIIPNGRLVGGAIPKIALHFSTESLDTAGLLYFQGDTTKYKLVQVVSSEAAFIDGTYNSTRDMTTYSAFLSDTDYLGLTPQTTGTLDENQVVLIIRVVRGGNGITLASGRGNGFEVKANSNEPLDLKVQVSRGQLFFKTQNPFSFVENGYHLGIQIYHKCKTSTTMFELPLPAGKRWTLPISRRNTGTGTPFSARLSWLAQINNSLYSTTPGTLNTEWDGIDISQYIAGGELAQILADTSIEQFGQSSAWRLRLKNIGLHQFISNRWPNGRQRSAINLRARLIAYKFIDSSGDGTKNGRYQIAAKSHDFKIQYNYLVNTDSEGSPNPMTLSLTNVKFST
jgi:hypothetical protein